VAPDLARARPHRALAGHHLFRDNAADIAAWLRAVGLDGPEAQVSAQLGRDDRCRPAPRRDPATTLVLLDPPAVPLSIIARMADDPAEVPGPDLAATIADLAARNPAWSARGRPGQGRGAAGADVAAARAIVLDNGDWDAGLADLSGSVLRRIPTWIVRATRPPAASCRIAQLPASRHAGRCGPHPDPRGRAARTATAVPEATTLALLRRSPETSRGRLSAVRRLSSIARSYAST
jgi:hypothetical protein